MATEIEKLTYTERRKRTSVHLVTEPDLHGGVFVRFELQKPGEHEIVVPTIMSVERAEWLAHRILVACKHARHMTAEGMDISEDGY